ncbi:hypothetical protein WR25_22280 [Diploscapter pachys]|uniref:Uncharacterized protein n=1 Tax=Diploscapter pachys TaxID=2018661 RepID=A0A2A2L5K4_9BILA|nr:hypothetical protein WR25_22280 [Diploscapter pachys]
MEASGKGGRRWTAEISNQQNKGRSRRGDRFITDENRYKSEVEVERRNARMNTLGTGQGNRIEWRTRGLGNEKKKKKGLTLPARKKNRRGTNRS